MNYSTITTILFDLDGTLLPLNERVFMEGYLNLFALKCQHIGIDEDDGITALFKGLDAMRANDGSMTNKDLFWNAFFLFLGGYRKEIEEAFVDFYFNEFTQLVATTYPSPLAPAIVKELKSKGYRIALATTPVFPREGTHERMRWAGLDQKDFEIITTYEDYSFTKPSLGYYHKIFSDLGVHSNEVLMIGNDITDDGAIMETGAACLFVADHLINSEGKDLKYYEIFSLSGLYELVKQFPDVRERV